MASDQPAAKARPTGDAQRRHCPASTSVLIRTAGLLAVAAGVILALPPLSKGADPAAPQASFVGIVNPGGDLSGTAMRRQPPARPALREGRLAALTEPGITASIAPPPAAHAVTVTEIGTAPAVSPRTASLAAPTLPVLPPPHVADLPAVAAKDATPAALPLPRPEGLSAPKIADAGPSTAASGDTAALVQKARRMIAHGQLTDGRATLKEAVAAGSSHAATVLAKTYDPAVLKSWHVKGATVDPTEARRWYEKAEQLGAPAAQSALARLR